MPTTPSTADRPFVFRLGWGVTLLYAAGLLTFNHLPPEDVPRPRAATLPHFDKLVHLAGYAGLALLVFGLGLPTCRVAVR